jgi:hypothetical protein
MEINFTLTWWMACLIFVAIGHILGWISYRNDNGGPFAPKGATSAMIVTCFYIAAFIIAISRLFL